MYKIGEYIVYGNDGVCEIEDIGGINIPGISKNKKYYTLNPKNENAKIFAPIDTKVFMRPVVTYEEIQNIIKEIPLIKKNECDEMNAKLLQEYYKKLLNSHKCIDLLAIIIAINKKKSNLNKNGKSLGQIDDKFLKLATNLLEDEFSVVLGIPKEDVILYIQNKIK